MTSGFGYRPEVDGLRALAVVPVLLFHLGVEISGGALLPGGYLGVDVFFVISGYLITGILIAEMAEERFSFLRFIERRARRILPALLLVVLVCIPVAYIIFTPNQMINFAQSLVAVVTFSSNMLFWKESGYFDTSTELKPLLHTWSLAVEEQFYILFPALLLLGWKVLKGHVLWAVGLLCVLSFFGAIALRMVDPSAAFYFLPARGWELLAGAFIALWEHRGGRIGNVAVAQIVSLSGLLAIILSMALIKPAAAHPGVITVPTVLGTAAILAGARGPVLARTILSWRLFVGLGLISYSLYLWHQPLIAFMRMVSLDEPGPIAILAVAGSAIILAALSWRFVETPFRRRGAISVRTVFCAGVATSVLIGGIGLAGHLTRGFPDRLSPSERAVADSYWEREVIFADGVECHAREPEDACRLGSGGTPWYVVGDSHGPTIFAALSDRLDLNAVTLTDLTQSGCPFVPNLTGADDYGDCYRRNLAVGEILSKAAPSTIIYVARYPLYWHRGGFDNGEGGVEHLDLSLAAWDGTTDQYLDDVHPGLLEAAFPEAIAKMLESGHRVALIYPIPEAGWHVPRTAFKLKRFGPYEDADVLLRDGLLTTDAITIGERLAPVERALDALPDHPNLVRVRPKALFCGTRFPGRCETEDETDTLYLDENHLSRRGAARVVDTLLDAIAR